MARKRASMREGPLAELFRATEAAQRQAEREAVDAAPAAEAPVAPQEETVEHVPVFDEPPAQPRAPAPRQPAPETVWEPQPAAPRGKQPEPEPERAPAPPPPRVSKPAPEAPAPVAPSESAAPAPPAPVVPRAPDPAPREPSRWIEPMPEPAPRLNRVSPDAASYLAVIRVVGVGGAGLNALHRMMDAGVSAVDFLAVNTDIQQLQVSDAPTKIHIGRELTQGLGSGSDADVGRLAAEESYDQIKQALRGSDMVFVTAGEGGGTGSGAAPVVARIAKELGALTVGIVTTPFKFEGTRRHRQATDGVDTLRGNCDTVIVVPNERLLEVLDRETSMLDAFRIADDVLRQGVQGICDLITLPGLINLDFADVRTIMKDAGTALMGIGFSATGENRAREAAEHALRSPLIDTEIAGAKGILLSIAGGDDLSLFEVNEAAELVRQASTGDTNIIFGATVDDRLTGQVWVTVVATGFGARAAQRRIAIRAEAADEEALEPPSFLQP
jgi:cell division protein FtsZ